jgi:putative hydrolase of the HAD superfamily
MPVRTVFLDWGGTLAYEPDESAGPAKIWARVLADLGEEVGEDRIRLAIGVADRSVLDQIYSYLGRTPEFWRMYEDRVMDALGLTSDREEVARAVQRVFDDPTRIRLYPESRRTLEALRRRGYRTGLISNHHDGLLQSLRHHELEPLFDTVTYSQEAGAEKPEPAVFSLALERAGCAPSDAVHVGNSIDADVGGARRSGIAPVWLDRERTVREVGCPTIHTLDELLPLLDQMRAASADPTGSASRSRRERGGRVGAHGPNPTRPTRPSTGRPKERTGDRPSDAAAP